jgi:arsenite methyltransferase
MANAHRVGVADRVRLVDGDMTDLPFPENSFDLVLACLSVHNLHPSSRREKAMLEAVRVLRPGGRIAVVDIYGTKTYLSVLVAAGMRHPRRSSFLAGMFPPARAVTALEGPPPTRPRC